MARYGRQYEGQRLWRPGAPPRGGRGYAADFGRSHAGPDDFHGGYGGDFGGRRMHGQRAWQRGPGMRPEYGWEYAPRDSRAGGGWPGAGRRAAYRPGWERLPPVRAPYVGEPTGPQPPNPPRGTGPAVQVAEIMTEDPEAVTVNSTVAVAARKMKDLDVGIIPVVDNLEDRRLRGVVTDRDLALRVLAEGRDGKTKISSCMTTDVETCGKFDTIDDVVDVMRSERVRRVPITDEEGRLVGIVAQADLAVRYAGIDFDREIQVEEAIERISEPSRPETV